MRYLENLTITEANADSYSQLIEVDQDLVVEFPVALNALYRVGGSLIVKALGKLEAPVLQEVGGRLLVCGKVYLMSIRTVKSHLYVYSAGYLESPELVSIGKGLYVYPDSVIEAGKIRKIGGGLSINSESDFPDLMHVGGGLAINAPCKLSQLSRVDDFVYVFTKSDVVSLSSIGGDLVVHPGGTLTAPLLSVVGKRLVLYAHAKLDQLSFVGGDVHICADNTLSQLSEVKGVVCIDSNAVFTADNLLRLPQSEEITLQTDSPKAGNQWVGRHWAALGTSITIFGAYTQPLNAMLGTILTNLSVGGGSLSTSTTSDPGGIYNQIVNIPLDADLVTFEAGMVDFRANAVLGSLYDRTLDTFYGAIFKSITDTLAANPKRTIAFITPYGIDSDEFKGRWNSPNENGNTFQEFIQAIKEVCDWCGIAIIDVGQGAGIGGVTSATYLADGVHLNSLGGMKMAEYLYDRLIFLRPCPRLSGSRDAGTQSWSLVPATALDFSGTGLNVKARGSDSHMGIDFTLIEGYYFSSLWLATDECNAIEFVSLPNTGNSLWVTLGSGDAGWIAVGDFGNLGAQRIAIFDAGHGSVTFGALITAKHSFDPNSYGMKWRVRRNGTIVQIYQHRASDSMWVETGNPIDLSRQGFSLAYYQEVKIGVLGTLGTASHVLTGTCGQL
jgi:lysophospholipase L1-like esterase